MSEVPCIVANHLTEAELRAYALADNRLGDMSDFDRDILAIEMSELSSLSLELGMELTIPGFEQVEIESLGFSTLRTAMAPEPAYPDRAVTRRGDIWRLGDHRLLCGDATQVQDHATLMRGDVASASFLDPPYSVKIRGHVTSSREHREFAMGAGEMTDAEFTDFLASTISKSAENVCDGGVIYACIDWRHVHQMLEAMVRCGLTLLNIAVWVKPTPGMGSFLRSQHELVCIGRRGAQPHRNRVELGVHDRNRSNVWMFDGVAGGNRAARAAHADHPTPKPPEMIRDAFLDCTEPGDIVIDAFGGGGATLMAAQMCRRRARMMEIDERYCDVMVRRWCAYTGERAFLEASGRTFEEVEAERTTTAARGADPHSPSSSSRPSLKRRRLIMSDGSNGSPSGERPPPPPAADDDDEKVGYCRPPKKHQFKKGHSGYPKGRPKGSRSFSEEVTRQLDTTVVVRIGGKSKRMAQREVVVAKAIARSINGDNKATETLTRHDRRQQAAEKDAAAPQISIEEDNAFLAAVEAAKAYRDGE